MSDLSKLQIAEPVLITDGSAIASLSSSQPLGTENAILVRECQKGQSLMNNSQPVVLSSNHSNVQIIDAQWTTPLYANSISATIASVAGSSTTSLLYLWHPISITKKYEIKRIINTFAGSTGTDCVVKICRITAENAIPGGTLLTPVQFDGGDAVSGAIVRQQGNSPTRSSFDISSRQIAGTNLPLVQEFIFETTKGFVSRSSVAEGIEIRLVNNSITAITNLRFTIDLTWQES